MCLKIIKQEVHNMQYVNTKIIINTKNAGYGIRIADQLMQSGFYTIVRNTDSDIYTDQDIVDGCAIYITDENKISTCTNLHTIVLTNQNIVKSFISYSDDILYVSKSIGIQGLCDLIRLICDKESKEKKAERAAADIIRKMGIPVSLKGYRYLITAIVTAALSTEADFPCAAEIYQRIADIHKVHTANAERAIMHSIEVAHERCPDAISDFFSYPVTKPNNNEFICYVADTIRLWVL